jgi:hypothetical protein
MQDPHVIAIHYRVEANETVTYVCPPPVEWSTAVFDMHLADGKATFTLKEHHASEQAARDQIEQFLRAWDLWMQLEHGSTEIRFVFERVDLVDRHPRPPPKPGEVRIVGTVALGGATVAGTLTVHSIRHRYPDPPLSFRASPLVEDLWYLYDRYRSDRERLLPVAYSCLHLVLWEVNGDLKQAARRYRVSDNVLKKLRELTSYLGDARTARKLSKGSFVRPPTAEETHWIEEVLKAVIRQVGRHAADPDGNWPSLTIASFPALEKS